MENSELPFDYGIYYTPTPPTKRMIYDLDQLSGGEKSIASLALQYALAICSNSPFLVLDESDAYLDANNAMKLLRLLGIASKGNYGNNVDKMLQIILVTHKPSMFGSCDSLVGVCRPKQQFSKVFSYKIK
jgi:structural maintenance of chromosome 1